MIPDNMETQWPRVSATTFPANIGLCTAMHQTVWSKYALNQYMNVELIYKKYEYPYTKKECVFYLHYIL